MALYLRNLRHKGSGSYMQGRAGQALGSKKLVYRNAVGNWQLADADALATLPVVGLTMGRVNAGQICEILLEGFIGSTAWAWTRGDSLYASQVAGELVAVAPVPPAFAQMVGVAVTPTVIYFDGMPASRGEAIGSGVDDFTYLVERTGANYTVYDDHGVVAYGPVVDADTAINWAFTNGGAGAVVYLKENNTFAINDPILFTANNQVLCGGGPTTFIDGDALGNNEHAIVITAFTDCVVKDLSVQTQDGGGVTSHCIYLEDGANGFLVEHVNILASDDVGIYIAGTSFTHGDINGCYITTTDGNGIHVQNDVANPSYRLTVSNCQIINSGNAGIWFDNTAGTYYCLIHDNIIYNPAGIGIYVSAGDEDQINGNTVVSAGLSGIHLLSNDNLNVTNNIVESNERHGIYLTITDTTIVSENTCNNNDALDSATYDGIHVDNSSDDNTIINNTCRGNHRHGIYVIGSRNQIVSNIVAENDEHGIVVSGGDCQVNDNHVEDNSQDAAGTSHGIYIMGSGDRAIVIGNHINGFGDSQEDGIHLGNGSTEVLIEGNHCQDGMGSGIALSTNDDNCVILGNFLMDNDDYGIEISAVSCNDNVVRENYFTGNGIRPFLDDGTNTSMHTETWDFTHYGGGSAGWTAPIISTSPGGIDIDANDEFAFCTVPLPRNTQQVMRISIWAYSNGAWAATNVLNMLLRIVIHTAGSTEAWNTHTIDVANHPSEEDGSQGIAVYDVIHWVIDRTVDQTIDNFAFHDLLQILAVGEAAVVPDLATDALFGGVEIEYV